MLTPLRLPPLGERPRGSVITAASTYVRFVGDAVRANLLAAAAPPEACGRAYNVARGERTTVSELADRMRSLAGSAAPPRHEPARAGDVLHSQADPAQAQARLGFRAGVDLEEGLALTLAHYHREEPSWRS